MEKAVLLNNTFCFVFPSRFEGFGIPLLEAMDAGIPIIASDIPSSKEVAGGNALFFEKEDAKALAKLMEKLALDPELGKKMTEQHQQTLQKYSWEKCAEQVYEIIQAKH